VLVIIGIGWLVLGIATAIIADRRGSGAGRLLGPIGLIAALANTGRDCPYCKRKIHNESIVCPYCQRESDTASQIRNKNSSSIRKRDQHTHKEVLFAVVFLGGISLLGAAIGFGVDFTQTIFPPSPDELHLTAIQDSLLGLDSLTFTLDDSNLLLDAMRAKGDSAEIVNAQLIRDAERLNHELRRKRDQANSLRLLRKGLERRRDALIRKISADE
jgi:RNA polymerase subunit RPABC4/transcription elongation factor Spt4